MISTQKIKTFLWFNTEAEEAAKHYVAAFPDSRINHVARHGEAGPGPAGSVMIVDFTLAEQAFVALNGGPRFTFTEAISLAVTCEDQAEVDRLWDHLLFGGGQTQACGWLKDRYGLSWQVVPRRFFEMMEDTNETQRNRAFAAMMQMIKFDVGELEKAYRG